MVGHLKFIIFNIKNIYKLSNQKTVIKINFMKNYLSDDLLKIFILSSFKE